MTLSQVPDMFGPRESRVDKWMKYTFNSFSTSETTSSSTAEPSESPSETPTTNPSSSPSSSSSFVPTRSPSVNPSDSPTGKPSMAPSKRPTFNSTGETIEITPSGAPMHLDLILASSVAGVALFCCILSMGLSTKQATAVDNQTKSSGELEEPLSGNVECDIEAMMNQVVDLKIIDDGNDADGNNQTLEVDALAIDDKITPRPTNVYSDEEESDGMYETKVTAG